ncbi:MAG: hypothetical protein J6A51_03915, partial [Clostridia bacterium]|nr:hypothetical protein [Clostridia bacterium]
MNTNKIKIANNSKDIQEANDKVDTCEERITELENNTQDCLEKEITIKPFEKVTDEGAEVAGIADKNIEVTKQVKQIIEESFQGTGACIAEIQVNKNKITDHEERIETLETDVTTLKTQNDYSENGILFTLEEPKTDM